MGPEGAAPWLAVTSPAARSSRKPCQCLYWLPLRQPTCFCGRTQLRAGGERRPDPNLLAQFLAQNGPLGAGAPPPYERMYPRSRQRSALPGSLTPIAKTGTGAHVAAGLPCAMGSGSCAHAAKSARICSVVAKPAATAFYVLVILCALGGRRRDGGGASATAWNALAGAVLAAAAPASVRAQPPYCVGCGCLTCLERALCCKDPALECVIAIQRTCPRRPGAATVSMPLTPCRTSSLHTQVSPEPFQCRGGLQSTTT